MDLDYTQNDAVCTSDQELNKNNDSSLEKELLNTNCEQDEHNNIKKENCKDIMIKVEDKKDVMSKVDDKDAMNNVEDKVMNKVEDKEVVINVKDEEDYKTKENDKDVQIIENNKNIITNGENDEDSINKELKLNIEKMLESDSLIEDFTTVTDNGQLNDNIITKEILEEERKLEQQARIEAEKMKREMMEKVKKEEEEKCLKRLHLLLSRSSIYAKFMADKLEQHEIVQKKRLKQHGSKKAENNKSSENKGTKRKAEQSSSSLKKQKTEMFIDVLKNEDLSHLSSSQEAVNNNPVAEQSNINKDNVVDTHPSLFSGGVMRQYQIEGYEWLKSLYENGVNGILADEMGLGKTIQCIAFIAYLIEMGIPGPFIVCAPLSTLPNWFAEFRRFAPDIPVILYHGSIDERVPLQSKMKKKVTNDKVSCCPVIITSFSLALIDATKLSKIEWKILVIDEAHRIKNFECKLIKELKRYNSQHRLLLTGTPLQNNLTELWSLLNFILPEIFDDLKVFQSWFDVTVLSQKSASKEIIAIEQEKKIVSTIHQILTPFLLRRTKADVELELPAKKEVIVHAPLTDLQQKYYAAVLNKSIDKLLNAENIFDVEKTLDTKRISKKTQYFGCENGNENIIAAEVVNSNDDDYFSSDIPNILNLKLQNTQMLLRHICNHPYIICSPIVHSDKEAFIKASGKLMVLDLMLAELKKRGHKVIIFSQFVTMLEILEDYCTLRGYKYCHLYGRMSLKVRQEEIEEFKDESVFIFLISTKAGGLGLNLIEADTVIIYDSDWNPQNDIQAQDRCHRIGQTKPVIVYRLIVPNTMDERIISFSDAKRKLEKVIIQKGRFKSKDMNQSHKAITKEEMIELLEMEKCALVKTDINNILTQKELHSLLDRSDM